VTLRVIASLVCTLREYFCKNLPSKISKTTILKICIVRIVCTNDFFETFDTNNRSVKKIDTFRAMFFHYISLNFHHNHTATSGEKIGQILFLPRKRSLFGARFYDVAYEDVSPVSFLFINKRERSDGQCRFFCERRRKSTGTEIEEIW